jgi:hypothetical protein
LDAADRRIAYGRDISHVEEELDELKGVRAQMQDLQDAEAFASQVELGIRINTVIRDWLREQIANAGDAASPRTSRPTSRP